MSLILVNSMSDGIADDGVTTLREAIQLAATTPEADTIRFATGIVQVELDPALGGLVVAEGQDLTILGDRDGDGAPDVVIDAGFDRLAAVGNLAQVSHFEVVSGAQLALVGLRLTGAGHDVDDLSDPRGDATASISNAGVLRLTRTVFDGNEAYGGFGTVGEPGFNGRDGEDGFLGVAAIDGGPGEPGTIGGRGDDARGGGSAALILNLGEVIVTDVAFGPQNIIQPGPGGDGGRGGNGGRGGDGGDGAPGFFVGFNGGPGGAGGRGGDGGNGGDEGDGAAILNLGTVTGDTPIADSSAVVSFGAGQGGIEGQGGAGGSGGSPRGFPLGSPGRNGFNGADGVRGRDGDPGLFGAVVNPEFIGGTSSVGEVDTLVFLHPTEAQRTEADTLVFNLNRLGSSESTFGATYRVVDANGGLIATETVRFESGGDGFLQQSIDLGNESSPAYFVSITSLAPAADSIGTIGLGTASIEISGLRIGEGLTPEEARMVALLYEAGLDRDGMVDLAGLNFWIDQREAGLSVLGLSAAFLDSDEFQESAEAFLANGTDLTDANVRNGDVFSNEDYVVLLYENVLDRMFDVPGRDFWLGVLETFETDPNQSMTARERLLLAFAESDENRDGSPVVDTLTEISPGEWDFV